MAMSAKISLLRTIAFGLALLTAPMAAAAMPTTLEAGESGRVVDVVDGDTLWLDDGLAVRLVGIQAPKLALGRASFRDWPLAEEARAALATMCLGETVALYYGGVRRDRHGRALAHVAVHRRWPISERGDEANADGRQDEANADGRQDGLWLQRAMLEAGLARVYSFADNRALVAELLAFEANARAAGRGIWGHPFYRIRTPAQVAGDVGSFQLVEGRVSAAAKVRGRLYLNFGDDWRQDFTISVAPRDRRPFEVAWGKDAIEDAAGRLLRVRGWIDSYNGPMIEATHPEQIEWLE